MINYGITIIVPLMLLCIVIIGLKEKKEIFKLFVDGVLEGLKIVYNIFPFILAITILVGILKSTGALDLILSPLKPVLLKLGIPEMASVIMGATETTVYTSTILFGAVKIKKIRGVLIAGLIADLAAIVTAIILVNMKIIWIFPKKRLHNVWQIKENLIKYILVIVKSIYIKFYEKEHKYEHKYN